jgi:hypothetical protein
MSKLQQKFSVYRNLNNGQLSIKNTKTGLVVGHCQKVIIQDAIFKVSLKGVERIRKIKQKSVVAMVVGEIYHIEGFISYKGRSCGLRLVSDLPTLSEKVFFNPYKWDGFVNEEGVIQQENNLVEISKSGEMLMS